MDATEVLTVDKLIYKHLKCPHICLQLHCHVLISFLRSVDTVFGKALLPGVKEKMETTLVSTVNIKLETA